MCIENAAAYCLNSSGMRSMECDLEEYEALVTSLEEARDYHIKRVESINTILWKLRGHEGKMSHDPVKVEKLLNSLGNSVKMDVSYVLSCGF